MNTIFKLIDLYSFVIFQNLEIAILIFDVPKAASVMHSALFVI